MAAMLRAGLSLAVAGRCLQIDPDTLSRWKGRPEPRYRRFCRAIDEAEALGELRLVQILQRAADIDPRYACWLLSRRFGTRWGTKVVLNNEVAAQPALAHWDLSTLDDKELAALESLAAKAGKGRARVN
jgi:hypothetical protein